MRGLLILLVAATAACGKHHAAQDPEPATDVPLQINNHHWLDVTVYVIHDGQRTRLGLVTGSSTQTFTIPARLIGQSHELALYGAAVGSGESTRTETLIVHSGQYIEWTLESRLNRSSVGVY